MKSLSHAVAFILAAIAAAAPLHVASQSYPTKPIRVVVPYPPGALDIYVRMMAPHMQGELGQPIVVDNRPGAAGVIGAEHVARSAPDGYTLVALAAGTAVVGPLVSKRPFDTLRDFTPVTMIYDSPQAMVLRSSFPTDTLKDFIDYAKRNPGKVSYASTGIGSAQHVDAEGFRVAAGMDMVHVPYAGFAPVIQALLGQQVDLAIISVGIAKPHIVGKKVKLIATDTGSVHPDLPKVPALKQVLPGYEPIANFVGIWGPAGLPRPILMRLSAASVKALQAPEVRSKIEEGGAVVGANTPEEFLAIVKASRDTTARMVNAAKAAGAKFE